MRVPGPYGNTYFLGSRAIRLTFLSQQQRAFNLIWALLEKRQLGKNVAVIGGGLGGMTAAIAAQQAGAKVVLYERRGDLLHLQRGCQLRFIHPNVYDWPDELSSQPYTRLPCLNWGADMAVRVVEAILTQWEEVGGNIRTLLNHEVRQIMSLGDGQTQLLSEGPSVHQKGYDSVVIAVGFGLERTLPRCHFFPIGRTTILAVL